MIDTESTHHQDELRRAPRVRVCCRADVRQAHGVLSAVTVDLSARGCRLVTAQLPRLGACVPLRLSSDLFPEELDTVGEVVWVDGEQVGVLFHEEATRRGSLSPSEWLEEILEHGRAPGPAGRRAGPDHVVPVVQAAPRRDAAIPLRSRRSG